MPRRLLGTIVAIFLIACGRSGAAEFDLDDAARLSLEAIKSSEGVKSVERKSPDELVIRFFDGTESSFFLDNLLINLNNDPNAEKEIIARYVTVLIKDAGPDTPRSQGELKRKVVPLIRHTDYVNFLRGAEGKSGEPLDTYLFRNFIADYWLILALDDKESTSVLRRSEFDVLQLSDDKLLELAAQNLKRLSDSELRIERANGVNMLVLDGNYESSMLIANDFWRKESTYLDDEIVAVAPARDLLMYCSKSNTECINRIHDLTLQNFDSFANAISTELIEWNGESWGPYEAKSN